MDGERLSGRGRPQRECACEREPVTVAELSESVAVPPEPVRERREGKIGIRLVSRDPDDECVLRRGGDGVEQRRLADAAVAAHGQQRAAALANLRERSVDRSQLHAPPDDRGLHKPDSPRRAGPASGPAARADRWETTGPRRILGRRCVHLTATITRSRSNSGGRRPVGEDSLYSEASGERGEVHREGRVDLDQLAFQVERAVAAALVARNELVDPLVVQVPGVASRASPVALDQHLDRGVAVDLDRSMRGQRGEAPFVVAAEEVGLGDRRAPGGKRAVEEQEDQRVDGASEALRPLDVAGADRVEERLLDLVLLHERDVQARRELARERRLARGGHAGDDDEERRRGHVWGFHL